ncbi:unnamed protein product, partial [Heterosigma akashiwo]
SPWSRAATASTSASGSARTGARPRRGWSSGSGPSRGAAAPARATAPPTPSPSPRLSLWPGNGVRQTGAISDLEGTVIFSCRLQKEQKLCPIRRNLWRWWRPWRPPGSRGGTVTSTRAGSRP